MFDLQNYFLDIGEPVAKHWFSKSKDIENATKFTDKYG